MERLTAHLLALMAAIAAAPDTPVDNLPLLGDEERQRLLVEWNDTDRDAPHLTYPSCSRRRRPGRRMPRRWCSRTSG